MYLCITDINECNSTNGNCSHECWNFPGGYKCSCNDGYNLNDDTRTCDGDYLE
jgi:Coagulation Factor Xa inhibitory site